MSQKPFALFYSEA